jgi:hypothetical protein
MFSFSEIVNNILVEASTNQPAWLQSILNKHKELYNTNVPDDSKLNQLYSIAIKRPSKQEILQFIEYVRIIDILKLVFNSSSNKPKDLATFYNDEQNSTLGKDLEQTISNLTPDKKYTWEIQDGTVRAAYNLAKADGDKEAVAALSNYDNLSIFEAVLKIIKTRTSIWQRITKLKSPFEPFVNLVTDIFKYPEEFEAGQRKVSSDFYEIVDNLYPNSVFKVGLAAKELFEAEIARLKKVTTPPATGNQNQQQTGNQNQQQTGNQNQQQTQTSQSGVSSTTVPRGTSGVSTRTTYANAGLNLFDTYFNLILVNEVGLFSNLKQGVQSGVKALSRAKRYVQDPQYRQKYKEVKDRLKQDVTNRINFVKDVSLDYKIVDANNKETGKIGKTFPKQYTVGEIKTLGTTEAINLINALQNIAQYTRKGIGAGERLKYAGQAASALMGFSGQSLYGGPR